MADPATGEKLPRTARFIDISDYARPLAVWIARRLKNTRVIAPHVTAAFGVVGLTAAVCYAIGGYRLALIGAAGMQIKNILDAVDGSLARLQNRPSRIGRFLDSITDAVVALALYSGLALAVARDRPIAYAVVVSAVALMLGLLQGTVFNFYYVSYRARRRGDTTSRVYEEVTRDDLDHYHGRPSALELLRRLIAVYNVIYGWQDALIRRIDRWAAEPLHTPDGHEIAVALRDDRAFLTAVSALGPGLQILVLDVYTVLGFRNLGLSLELFLWTVAVGGTASAAALLLRLRRSAARLAARPQAEPAKSE